MIFVLLWSKKGRKSLKKQEEAIGIRVWASSIVHLRYKAYTLLIIIIDPFLKEVRASKSHFGNQPWLQAWLGARVSDLGFLRDPKAESNCFRTHGKPHACWEFLFEPLGLILPCMHIKFVTLRARSSLGAWIYLLIKGCTSEIEDLECGNYRLGESVLGTRRVQGIKSHIYWGSKELSWVSEGL